MHTSGGGQGVLLDDGAELSAGEVRALTQKLDVFNRTVEGLKSDLSALKASAGMRFYTVIK